MGELDDAIRDHLELKRRRGADPAEVAREEHEALAPVTRSHQVVPAPAAQPAEPEPAPRAEPQLHLVQDEQRETDEDLGGDATQEFRVPDSWLDEVDEA